MPRLNQQGLTQPAAASNQRKTAKAICGLLTKMDDVPHFSYQLLQSFTIADVRLDILGKDSDPVLTGKRPEFQCVSRHPENGLRIGTIRQNTESSP